MNCAPLCGASRAYGRFVKWWQHEPQCPARQLHGKEGVDGSSPSEGSRKGEGLAPEEGMKKAPEGLEGQNRGESVWVEVIDSEGSPTYKKEHVMRSTFSFEKVTIEFEPELPPVSNGDTLTWVTSSEY